MLAENTISDKMATDIKDSLNEEKEIDQKNEPSKDEIEEGEDLEEGEITDDEEEAVDEKTESVEIVDVKKSEDNDKKRSHKDDSSSSKSKRLRKELDEDEEKKRLLKEKLRQLERQMADGDDDTYDDDEDDDDGDDQDVAEQNSKRKRSRSRSKSPKRRRRRSKSRERSKRDREGGHRSRRDQEKKKEICPQFMLGKCPKSPERCPYSHDADPPKIMELCKFYLLERCAKKEKCLYLHKGFPCKYFHTGHRCLDTAESCKFSHEPLTEVTRNILLKHLEGAPKEILGDFPRLTREAAQALVFQTEAKNKGWLSDEGKSVQDIQKNIGDAVIEEAKKQLPRKSRWGDPVGGSDSKNTLPTPTSNPGPAFGVPTNTPNPAILQGGGGPQQQFPQRPPFGGPPVGNGAPGLLGAPPPNLRPIAPPHGPGGQNMRPGFNNGPPGGQFQGPPQHQNFPPGYGDLGGFNDDQMRNFIRENNYHGNRFDNQGPPGPHRGNFQGGPPMHQDPFDNRNHGFGPYQNEMDGSNFDQGFGDRNFGGGRSDQMDNRHFDRNYDQNYDQDFDHGYDQPAGNTTPVNEDNDWNDQSDSNLQKRKDPRRDPRSRDPRSDSRPHNSRENQGNSRDFRRHASEDELDKEKEKRMLEVDLSDFGTLEIPDISKEDDDDKSDLPFKNIPNTVAKEIDASITAHSPLDYKLRKLALTKPDYSNLILKQGMPMSKILMDPRLRRYSTAAKPKKESPESSPKEDLRKNKKPEPELKKPEPEANVYNPSRDLYQKSTKNQETVQEVYSPTQDVQDLYKPPAALQRPPPDSLNTGYNPRQDLFGVGTAGNNPAWETNYNSDHSQNHPVQSRGDPRRRDPRRRD